MVRTAFGYCVLRLRRVFRYLFATFIVCWIRCLQFTNFGKLIRNWVQPAIEQLQLGVGPENSQCESVVIKLHYPQILAAVVSEDKLRSLLNCFYTEQDLRNYRWTLYAPLNSTMFCETSPKPLSGGIGKLITSPSVIIDMYHNISNPINAEHVGEYVRTLVGNQLCKGEATVDVVLLKYSMGKAA